MIHHSNRKYFGLILLTMLVCSVPVAYAEKAHKSEQTYMSTHSAEVYYTCLQWQKDAGLYLNRKTNGGNVLPVFAPNCGIQAKNSSFPHKVISDWMPEPGEGTSNAKNIIEKAMLQGGNFDSDKRFNECSNWQAFAVNVLQRSNYPAYPNTIKHYDTPHCGIRLSNNDTREHVYLWMPNKLISAKPTEYPSQICSLSKRDSYGQLILAKTPCALTNMSQTEHGIAITSINSDPRGAALIIDGVVIAHAPANLILDRLGNRSNAYTIDIKMEGYEEGSINVKSGDILMVPLTPKSAKH